MNIKELKNLYLEAEEKDFGCVKVTHPRHVILINNGYGIIKRDDGEIIIKSVNSGSNYYKKLTAIEEEIFLKKGWILGSLYLSLLNKKKKIRLYNIAIKNEANRRNPKVITNIKKQRDYTLRKYNSVLNKIKSYEQK